MSVPERCIRRDLYPDEVWLLLVHCCINCQSMVDGRARIGCEAGKSLTKEFVGRIIRLLTGRRTIGAALASLTSIGWILRTNETEQSHAMESSQQ
jgi:hypothetical protein